MKQIRLLRLLGALLLATMAPQPVSALHIDIVVGQSGGRLTRGFCAAGALGCDSLPVLAALGVPANTLPTDGLTGRPIFVTDFGDLDGGRFAVDDPGFFAGAGSLPPNLLLRYRALGSLSYWSPVTGLWSATTPTGERIRLAGGLDSQITQDTSHCNGLLICLPRTTETLVTSSTVFTTAGIEGPHSLIIDNTAANGSLHAHLDWFIELPNGQRNGSAGAYLVELSLTAAGFADSDSLYVLFNRGLDNTDFGRALLARMQAVPPPGDTGLGEFDSAQVLDVASGQRFDLAAQPGTPPAPYAYRALGLRGDGELALAGNTFVADVASGETSFSGTITGSGTLIKRGAGVQALLGGAAHDGITRIEGGTLRATPEALSQQVENHAALALTVAADAVYGGRIDGAGAVEKRGPGTLTLTGENTYRGGTYVNGPLRIARDAALGHAEAPLALEDASLTTTAAFEMFRPLSLTGNNVLEVSGSSLTLRGALNGAGTLGKRGTGVLALFGAHPFSGALQVETGMLRLQGSLAGSLQVHSGATLAADGAIGGDVLFEPGSRLRVDVDAAGAASRLVGRGSVHVGGAHLDVVAAPGEYPLHRGYDILAADGGVSGQFAAVSSSLAFLEPSLEYAPTAVRLRLTRNDLSYADLARTANQSATGRVLETLSRAPQGDLATVIDAFERAPLTEIPQALDSIAGTPQATVPVASAIQGNAVVRQVTSRLGALSLPALAAAPDLLAEQEILLALAGPGDGESRAVYASAIEAAAQLPAYHTHGIWLRGLVGFGEFDAATGQTADSDSAGLIVGYDWRMTRWASAGVFGAYADAEVNHEAPVARTATGSWQLGGYGRLKHRALHVDGLLAYGQDAVDTTREIAFADLARHARAEFDGDTLLAYLEAGYAVDTTPFLQPFVALQFSGQHRDAYVEQGAGALDLRVQEQDNESLRTLLGLRVRHVLRRSARGALVGELRGAWVRELGDPAAFRARLAGDQTGALFSVEGSQVARNIGNLGAGIVANLGPHAQAFLDFDGELSTSHHALSFGGGVRLRW